MTNPPYTRFDYSSGVSRQIINDSQLKIGKRTDGQRHPVLAQTGDQRRVFQRPVAMIDSIDSEHVQGFPDIARRAFFPRVGHELEALASGSGEDPLELRGRVSELGGVQTYPDELRAIRYRLLQHLECIPLCQVSKKTENERNGEAPLSCAPRCAYQTIHHVRKGDTACKVGLGIEKALDMANVFPFGAMEIRVRQFEEIRLFLQDLHSGVVQVQEILQPSEVVPFPDGADVLVRRGDFVAFRQVRHHLRFQGAFYVNVKLGLRKTLNEVCVVNHGSPRQMAG